MKKQLLGIGMMAAGVFVSLGYPFFKLLVDTDDGRKKAQGGGSSSWKKLRHVEVNHPRNGYADKYEDGKAWCAAQDLKDRYITSRDGLRLHAYYLPADNARRIVLLAHGYRGSGFGDFANIARFLHENGCDLLFVDQRCCGKSEGRYITYGAKEQWDIFTWTTMLAAKNRRDLPIYLYGMSMGAAAVMMASGHALPKNVKGLICDCGFSSMKQQLRDIAGGWFHIHFIELLLLRADLFCRILAHFKMKDADTSRALSYNEIPVLFFHGSHDMFVEPSNSVRNRRRCAAPSDLVIIDGARHLCSSYVDEDLYRSKLSGFFARYDV